MFLPKPLFAAIAAALSVMSATAAAYDERPIVNAAGTEVMRIRFFGVGDGDYLRPMDGIPSASTWDLSETQKNNIVAAGAYWAEIFTPPPGGLPAIVNVGTLEDENAFGTSTLVSDGELLYTTMQVALTGEAVPEAFRDNGSHGQFVMGRMDYAEGNYVPSQIGDRPGIDIAAVAAHELAHSLGMMSLVGDVDGRATPYFGPMLDDWLAHVVDDNGNPAQPNQLILCADCRNPYSPDAFDARQDKARLIGENVTDALEGGLPGVPVRFMSQGTDGSMHIDSDYISHIELNNSLMSHQSYRNYTRFMEVELALLEDFGYDLDRRNFFGRSVYGSRLNLVNDRGYFARNAEGTAYLPGQYNTASLGLGLHVYGSHNTIRQAADLLTAGPGGAGVRVDGEGNTLVVDPGVRIHALGLNGQGILFTYGKGHQLVQRGDVRATGPMGVGLRFDFGYNVVGSTYDHRGSYIRTNAAGPLPMLPELQGPLAERVDITGPVAGSAAAMYMAPTAWVRQVNIMRGARLEGDIVSDYAQRDELGALRLTTVSFGQQADTAGRANGAADSTFAMHYTGNIRGRDNLRVSVDGGAVALDGRHELHSMAIQPGAALLGNGQFAISSEGMMRNDGVIAPGYPQFEPAVAAGLSVGDAIGRIEVRGDFQQSDLGVVLADFNTAGAHDVVAVGGKASLGGVLSVQAQPGWYAHDWALDARVIEAAQVDGQFATIHTGVASPSLRFAATPLGGGAYRMAAVRPADAYSRYAADDNGRRAGAAIQQAVAQLGPTPPGTDAAAFGGFVTALDFSAMDGSDVRQALGQVSPAAYSAGVAASLHRERDVMDVALQGLRLPAGVAGSVAQESGARRVGQWQGFASAFGGKSDQNARDSSIGYDASTYGVVIGATQRLASNPAITVGGHLGIAQQSVTLDSPLSGKSRSTSLGVGVQAGYAPVADAGFHAWGGLRLGLEDAKQDRNVAAAGYRASHSADWTGHSASAVAGAGYRWAIAPGVSAGPVAALNYARVSRPGVDESGNAATRLNLDSSHFDALRSSLGLAARAQWGLEDGGHVATHVQATWDREWLSRESVQTAAFAAVPGVSFDSRNDVVPRNSLGLQAGFSYEPMARVAIGATVNGRVGGGYDAISGELRLRWAF